MLRREVFGAIGGAIAAGFVGLCGFWRRPPKPEWTPTRSSLLKKGLQAKTHGTYHDCFVIVERHVRNITFRRCQIWVLPGGSAFNSRICSQCRIYGGVVVRSKGREANV